MHRSSRHQSSHTTTYHRHHTTSTTQLMIDVAKLLSKIPFILSFFYAFTIISRIVALSHLPRQISFGGPCSFLTFSPCPRDARYHAIPGQEAPLAQWVVYHFQSSSADRLASSFTTRSRSTPPCLKLKCY